MCHVLATVLYLPTVLICWGKVLRLLLRGGITTHRLISITLKFKATWREDIYVPCVGHSVVLTHSINMLG
jgi:hypothetical protein